MAAEGEEPQVADGKGPDETPLSAASPSPGDENVDGLCVDGPQTPATPSTLAEDCEDLDAESSLDGAAARMARKRRLESREAARLQRLQEAASARRAAQEAAKAAQAAAQEQQQSRLDARKAARLERVAKAAAARRAERAAKTPEATPQEAASPSAPAVTIAAGSPADVPSQSAPAVAAPVAAPAEAPAAAEVQREISGETPGPADAPVPQVPEAAPALEAAPAEKMEEEPPAQEPAESTEPERPSGPPKKTRRVAAENGVASKEAPPTEGAAAHRSSSSSSSEGEGAKAKAAAKGRKKPARALSFSWERPPPESLPSAGWKDQPLGVATAAAMAAGSYGIFGKGLPMPSVASKEVEDFIASAGLVEPDVVQRFRNMPAHLQRLVVERGPIGASKNPTSVLISRMRDAELGRLTANLLNLGPAGGCSPEVEKCILQYGLDEKTASVLRALPSDMQKLAVQIPLSEAKNPSNFLLRQLTQLRTGGIDSRLAMMQQDPTMAAMNSLRI